MRRRVAYITLVHGRMPHMTSVTRVTGVDDMRDAYRIAFKRLLAQIDAGERPGPFSDWRLDHVTFGAAARMTALIPVAPKR